MRPSNPFDTGGAWSGSADDGYGYRDDDPLLGVNEIREQQAHIIRGLVAFVVVHCKAKTQGFIILQYLGKFMG